VLKKILAATSLIAAIAFVPMTARAEFRATDLYHVCNAGLAMNGETINDELACFNFLGQVWSRGVAAGQICSLKPVSNGEMAFTYTLNLWRMPPEYLSTRADVAALTVFSAYFPCAKPTPANTQSAPAAALKMVTGLPTTVGTCARTTVTEVGHRLEGVDQSGSFVRYANGGTQVSYEEVPAIGRSRIGDRVLMCLTSVPQGCPPGDDRGRAYKVKNLRTGEAWEKEDSAHSCGGA
jgi:hypothetical protein